MKPLIPTLMGCCVVGFVAAQPLFGALIVLMAMALLPWALYSIIRKAWRPSERSLRLQKVGLWAGALAVAFTVQAHRHATPQARATQIATAIEQHIQRFGACPKDLGEIGHSNQSVRNVVGAHTSYSCPHGKPILFYQSTYQAFDTEDYDFQERAWRHRHD